MESLGRAPRNSNVAGSIAKALAVLGVLVLIFGVAAIAYLVGQDGGRGTFVGGDTAGKVYLAVTVGPAVLVAVALLWGVAAYLWAHSRDQLT
jgi:hypothetical protein